MIRVAPVLVIAALGLSACGGGPRPRDREQSTYHPLSTILEKYDANHDGIVTRAELEAGLRADFAKADAKHAGCLDADEVSAVNQQRWQEDQSTASPLVDFTGKGCVDFSEFAATARSLFEQMDRDEDGQITQRELHPQRRPADDDR
jgi:Ca2+-binding EF-hand superfamily protein